MSLRSTRLPSPVLASLGVLLLASASCAPEPAQAGEHTSGEAHGDEGHAANARDHMPHGTEGDPEPTNRIALPAAARETLGVAFATAERRAVQRTQRIPGRIELRPGAVRSHHAPLAGPVVLTVDVLQAVEAGTPLATLRPPQLRADQDALHVTKHDIEEAADQVKLAEVRRAEAEKTAARLAKRIRALESVSARKADLEGEADAARSRLTVLEAELRMARSKLEREHHHFSVKLQAFAERVGEPLNVMETLDAEGRARWEMVDAVVLKAATAGVITALPMGLSGWAEAGEALVEVSDLDQWWYTGWVLEADLPLVAAARTATLVPTRGAPGDRIPVTLRLGPGSQPNQRRLQVLGEPAPDQQPLERNPPDLDAPELSPPAPQTPELKTPKPQAAPVWLRPGMSVFAEVVVSGSAEPEIAVPREAVVTDGHETLVFLRAPGHPDEVIRQPVTVGADDGRWVAVLDGVAPGDEVVTAGAYALKLSSGNTQRVKGHFHADGSFHPEED